MSDWYIGEIRLFSFARIPTGWAACDGSSVSISSNPALYQLIGTTYGGDGLNTFNLPDLRGRVPIAQGTGNGQPTYVLGQSSGEENHTLVNSELPSHSHALVSTTNAGTTATPATNVHLATSSDGKNLYNSQANAAPYDVMASSIGPAGGSVGHPNTMPTIAANFCIATTGIFPSS
jgi:microcystin-dependent protein